MNILLVHFDGGRSCMARSVRVSKLIKYFAGLGQPVTLLTTSEPTDVEGMQECCVVPYRPLLRGHSLVARMVNRVRYLPEPEQAWVPAALQSIRPLLTCATYDFVLVSTPPHAVQQVGAAIRREYGIPYIADFRDDWLTNPRYRIHTPLHGWAVRRSERQVVQRADAVLLNTPLVLQRFAQRYPDCSGKFHVVTNGYDEDDFAAPHGSSIPGLPTEKTVVFYGGSMYNFIRGRIAGLLEGLQELGCASDWLFVTAGEPFQPPVRWRDRWIHLGPLPQDEAARCAAAANLLLLPLPPGESRRGSGMVPLKTYGYLRSGRAILYVGEEGSATDVLRPFDGVFCFQRSEWTVLPRWMSENKSRFHRFYDRPGIERYNFHRLARQILGIAESLASPNAGHGGVVLNRVVDKQ